MIADLEEEEKRYASAEEETAKLNVKALKLKRSLDKHKAKMDDFKVCVACGWYLVNLNLKYALHLCVQGTGLVL